MHKFRSMRWFLGVFVIALEPLYTSGCASDRGTSYGVEFDQDVVVFVGSDNPKNLKRGESLAASDTPMTITRPGHASVILLPLPQASGTVKLKLPRDDNANADTSKNNLAADANKIAQSVIEIQSLIMEKRAEEALSKIQLVQENFPGFSYLRFLEASCFLIKNDVSRARELTSLAMQEFPDDRSGKQFLEELNSRAEAVSGGKVKESH